uniref:Gag_pre-integrs domain-containing protein n=1 Tax=Heterorhabditis bacteriophora TaxID=37862 RepID=A0A1I7WDQ9_HETBA
MGNNRLQSKNGKRTMMSLAAEYPLLSGCVILNSGEPLLTYEFSKIPTTFIDTKSQTSISFNNHFEIKLFKKQFGSSLLQINFLKSNLSSSSLFGRCYLIKFDLIQVFISSRPVDMSHQSLLDFFFGYTCHFKHENLHFGQYLLEFIFNIPDGIKISHHETHYSSLCHSCEKG